MDPEPNENSTEQGGSQRGSTLKVASKPLARKSTINTSEELIKKNNELLLRIKDYQEKIF